jgi:hypothetical protein
MCEPPAENKRREQSKKMARINAGSSGKKPENGLPPLTAVDSRRGNELSEAELHSIRLINEEEQRILSENPGLAAPGTDADVYYVCEDGRIFKIADNGYFYGFNFQDYIWEPDTAYMGMFMDQAAKFSMLRNFRDYYRTKSVKKAADDTDTVAALAGALSGAYYNSVPGEWLDKIWNRKLLDEIISRFTLSVADISL